MAGPVSTSRASGSARDIRADTDDEPDPVKLSAVPARFGHGNACDQGAEGGLEHLQRDRASDDAAPAGDVDRSLVKRPKAFLRRRLTAGWAYTREGSTPAVWVLIALTIVTAGYGWANRPDTTVPQPPASNIEVDFSTTHPARSPVTVGVRLMRDDPSPGRSGSTITLAIDLSGKDFAHAGWWVYADVPANVQVEEPQNSPHPYTSDGTAYVYIHPGPQPRGGYTALLNWNNLTSGPMQVIRANLVAAFPTVTVINETKSESAVVPTPHVTVNRALDPGGDFSYLGGSQPDRFVGVYWQWSPVTGTVNDPLLAYSFNVEAKSASLDGQAHRTEFYSGIASGVAAAAAIAGLVEFVKADRRKRKPAGRPARTAVPISAGGDPHGPDEPRSPQGAETDSGQGSAVLSST